MDISRWVAHWAAWSPAKTALRFEGTQIAYAELEDRIARLAGVLHHRGAARGDRIAFLGPNCPELLEAFLACARLGAAFVPLNARMPSAELEVYVKHTRPKLITAEDSFHGTARAALAGGTAEILPFAAGGGIGVAGDRDPDRIAADPDLASSTSVLIAFTSGTTGSPKGAVLTHGSLAANALNTVCALQMTAQDEILTFLPMFHIAGLNLITTPALSIGATVTVHRQFDPGAVLQDVHRLAVTLTVIPPPLTLALAAHPLWPTANLGSLRCVMTGGTTVTEQAVQPWHERGIPVIQAYGSTETGGNTTAVPLDEAPRKSMTAGKPTLSCQVRVVDASGAAVPSGEPGEIVVRGTSVMQEYFENPAATQAAMPGDWFRTGDLGMIDEEGYLHVVGRIKEIIIVGVSNVYPADLEAILEQSPDIAAAAVVGAPDEESGEVPVAFVVPAPGRFLTPGQVLDMFHGRLAPYKRPRRVIFLDALPRTSVGKVEKKALQAMTRAGPEQAPVSQSSGSTT